MASLSFDDKIEQVVYFVGEVALKLLIKLLTNEVIIENYSSKIKFTIGPEKNINILANSVK